jgi:GDPmannose 4,6-dehydratase
VEELKPRYFINFAAQSYVASSWDFAKHTWETNSTAVLDILEAIRIHCHSCRFYNAGSSEEFGNVQYSPQDELHPARPRSPYGASKTAARQLVKVYRESYDLYAVQGWLFNHEGERRGEEFVTKKIAKNVVRIKNALLKRERFLPMELGNLDAKRDWSYAPDLIEGVWRMLNQDVYRSDVEDMISSFDKSGKLMLPRDINPTWHSIVVKNLKDYVLGSGENHTIREFVESAFNAVGIVGTWVKTGDELTEQFVLVSNNVNHTIPLVTINPKFYRPAEVDTLLANPILAKTDLNWKTKTSFDDLIKIMVDSENRKQSV